MGRLLKGIAENAKWGEQAECLDIQGRGRHSGVN